jgi:hypothetical protein
MHAVRKLCQKWLEKDFNTTDARFTTMYIAKCIGISVGSAHSILRRDLKIRRMCQMYKSSPYKRAKTCSGKNLQRIVETVP